MVALPVLVLVFALVFGVPIAVALAGSGMLGIYLVTGDLSRLMAILSLTPFSTVADYALTTIPMFILVSQGLPTRLHWPVRWRTGDRFILGL